jgi:hypothetical protein
MLRSASVSVLLLDEVRQLALEHALDDESLEELSRLVTKVDPWPPLDSMLEAGIIDERVRDRAGKPVEPEEGLGSAGNWLSLMMLIDTKRVGTRLVIALERYRLAEGQFPAALEALAPRFIEKVPGDPATGMPLEYRREGDRYTLYSLGVDRVDDGGKTAPLAHKALEPDPARHAGLDHVLNEPRPRAIGH